MAWFPGFRPLASPVSHYQHTTPSVDALKWFCPSFEKHTNVLGYKWITG